MTENSLSLAARHQATCYEFSEKVDNVRDWDAPTPVEGWVARDVVRHLVDWSRALFGSVLRFGEIPSVDEDPAGAWHAHADQVQALLEDPKTAEVILEDKHFGTQPVTDAIDAFYLPDVFMHTWDLARASGQNADLDPVVCTAMLAGMEQQEEYLRASGEFGTRQEVKPGASPEEKLIAFIGRDPYWIAPKK